MSGARAVTKSELWKYPGEKSSWFFVTLDSPSRKKVDRIVASRPKRKGWGQVAVDVRIGATSWRTSVFPDKDQGWVMPVKAAVRKKEGLEEGDRITVSLDFSAERSDPGS